MSKLHKLVFSLLFLFIISACSTSQTEENSQPNNPYMNLSTEGQKDSQQNEQLPNGDEVPESNDELTEEGAPQEDQEQALEEDENVAEVPNEHNSLQQTIPEELPSDELVPDEIETEENTSTQETSAKTTEVPFQHFKERWNAVSDEQFSDLYIDKLEKSENDERIKYRAQLTNKMELQIFVVEEFIQQLDLISTISTKDDIFRMLSGWQQVINILHPNIEIQDVDEIFNRIGVGPDADLSKVKAVSFPYYQLHYEVDPLENGYRFSAKPQENTEE